MPQANEIPESDLETPVSKESSNSIHPYAAGMMLVIDNVFFGANIVTMGLGTLGLSFLAFMVVGTGTFLIQRHLMEENSGKSLAKGFLLGVLAGVPTSIMGSAAGLGLLTQMGVKKLLKK